MAQKIVPRAVGLGTSVAVGAGLGTSVAVGAGLGAVAGPGGALAGAGVGVAMWVTGEVVGRVVKEGLTQLRVHIQQKT